MKRYRIRGGRPLKGKITPQGTKNEALQVICATLLTSEPVFIHNIPDILDVHHLIHLLKLLGTKVEPLEKGVYRFTANNLNLDVLDAEDFMEYARKLRGSVLILGPLLGRFGKAKIPAPGGDRIGRRRLDTHMIGFQKLGATCKHDIKQAAYIVHGKKLRGSYMLLDEASVTGTANIVMAAVLTEGMTTIYHAACEPHIQQLCKMLIQMGADINGIGSNLLTIHGVGELEGARHTIAPDILEIGSFIGLAAITKGELIIDKVSPGQLGLVPDVFRKLGIALTIKDNQIHVHPQTSYEIKRDISGAIPTISDGIWPGFPADLLSIVLVAAVQAKGTVLIHQKNV